MGGTSSVCVLGGEYEGDVFILAFPSLSIPKLLARWLRVCLPCPSVSAAPCRRGLMGCFSARVGLDGGKVGRLAGRRAGVICPCLARLCEPRGSSVFAIVPSVGRDVYFRRTHSLTEARQPEHESAQHNQPPGHLEDQSRPGPVDLACPGFLFRLPPPFWIHPPSVPSPFTYSSPPSSSSSSLLRHLTRQPRHRPSSLVHDKIASGRARIPRPPLPISSHR